ncbi:MAG: hypothetical protein EOP85_17475 [Verrucomicrobiaceae bacterium]|nr:MAG: hypothetical protein EOP85_17475 [Verrucomicrobiaceae bacterium]
MNDTNEFVFLVTDENFLPLIVKGSVASPAAFRARIEKGTVPTEMVLIFSSESGATYQVESSTTLQAPWVDVGPVVSGTGTEITVPLGTVVPPRNFFRVRKVSP